MNNTVRPYEFENLTDYLKGLLEDKKKRNELFSIRAWAKLLGYNGPAYLAQAIKLERKPNLLLIERIRTTEKLDLKEWRHLKLLFLRSLHQELDGQLFVDLLELNKPYQPFNISLEAFDIISEWYYTTIIEMAKIKDLKLTAQSVQANLVKELDLATIENALEFLVRAEFLTKKDDEYIYNLKEGVGNIFSDVASPAIQLFHSAMLDISKEAITEQPKDERHFMASTLGIRVEIIDKANAIIEEAHRQIQNLSTPDSDAVYQFNSQFIRMTKKRS
jgi:uncharacterized protein (TIGR02147 family)